MNAVPIDCVTVDDLAHLAAIGGHVVLDSGDEVQLVFWGIRGPDRTRARVQWPSGRQRTLRKSAVVSAVVPADTDVTCPARDGAWAS